jgi:hypothetical protein
MSQPNTRSQEVAPEAYSELTSDQIHELSFQAERGDKIALDTLINHYMAAEGDNSESMFFWMMEAARRGHCDHWRELMFITAEDGGTIPAHLFGSGETLEVIGERHGCGPYERLRPQRAQDAQSREAEEEPRQN